MQPPPGVCSRELLGIRFFLNCFWVPPEFPYRPLSRKDIPVPALAPPAAQRGHPAPPPASVTSPLLTPTSSNLTAREKQANQIFSPAVFVFTSEKLQLAVRAHLTNRTGQSRISSSTRVTNSSWIQLVVFVMEGIHLSKTTAAHTKTCVHTITCAHTRQTQY